MFQGRQNPNNKSRATQQAVSKYLVRMAYGLLLVSTLSSADSYDQAVNKYLEGFEYCNTAKDYLNDGRLTDASKSLAKYAQIRDQAAKIDPTILSSTRREMDSNIKYCQRVGTDVEVQTGTPILNQAIEACDESIKELKNMSPDAARGHYDRFLELRDKALAMAPSLNNVFSARSQINRCDRVEKKFVTFQKKQAESSQAVELALSNSENYASACADTSKGLKQGGLDAQSVKSAKSSLEPIQSLKSLATGDAFANEYLANSGFAAQKQQFDAYIASGDSCMVELKKLVADKDREIGRYKAELGSLNREVVAIDKRCDAVINTSASGMNQARYKELSKQYDAVVADRNGFQGKLSRSSIYKQSRDWPDSRKINTKLAELNSCIDKSSNHLAALFKEVGTPPAKAVVAKVPVPAPVVKKFEPTQSSEPARVVKGTIKLAGSMPQVALAYLVDGQVQKDVEQITITPSGFDQQMYAVSSGDTIRLKSRDFAFHRTSLNIPGVDYPEAFAIVQSRQQKDVKVEWPINTLATLRSDRPSVVPAFIANIPTREFSRLSFDSGNGSASFELKAAGKATRGYILMSGYDPIEFELNKGETSVKDVVRDSTVQGNVLLQGQ